MIRLFQTHRIRKITELEGMWDFTKAGSEQEIPDSFDYRLPVPGCWESHPQLNTYRGRGWYRTRVSLNKRTSLRLEFKGVSHTADVYFDGRHIAHHYNAYTPFSVIVSDVDPGDYELAVLVDNTFSEASALHVPNDYYTYGGLIRPVAVEEISEVVIERLHFTPNNREGAWKAEVKAVLHNLSGVSKDVELRGQLGGTVFDFGTLNVGAGMTVELAQMLDFPGVKPWSHEDPQLYMLEVQLFMQGEQRPVDDFIERVGFRMVTTTDGKIRINGREVILKGFCRHEDHPFVGAAFPLQLMVKDIDLMQDMGANSVRTSHYPYDERFLDLCDERGIYVWEENHARGLELHQMRHPYFAKQCEDCNREMVENHYNHPSIIIWGILNECASHTVEGRVHYSKQLQQIRSMDQSRPLSYASNRQFTDLCLDLVDIVSLNIYPGWYVDDDPGELADRLKQWADLAGGQGKPMIMSEFGGDGFYGYRSPTRVKGTEERQADIMENDLAAFLSRPYITGLFIWQFCDCRVTEAGGWLLNRACTKNSKGIVDEYRRPKLAYELVRKYFRENY